MKKSWHVLGAGAIGGLFAFRLREGGAHVTLLSRDDPASTRDLTLTTDRIKTMTFAQERATTSPFSPKVSAITHLLVCTKAWAASEAISSVAERLTDQSTVVLLCNGMGLAEHVTPLLKGSTLVLGSTTAGCRKASQNQLIQSGEGKTLLGTINRPCDPPDWLSNWEQGVPEFSWTTDIRSVLLGKVALNAVINPLTALNKVANGALLAPPLRDITEQVIAEVQTLLHAACENAIAETLAEQVNAVCTQTAGNHSSMRVDLEMGRRTEIDAIVGWLLRELVSDPPPTPVLSQIYDSVRGLERGLPPN